MKKLVAANWKMHMTRQAAIRLVHEIGQAFVGTPPCADIVLFPPFTALAEVGKIVAPWSAVGAQNFYPADSGAFTGEVSLPMLADSGCSYVLAGHSERRVLFHESSAFIGQKVAYAARSSFHVIFCVGETLEEREAGRLADVLEEQIHLGLQKCDEITICEYLTIAYEPVWAIGTGKVAARDDILQAHGLIRQLSQSVLGARAANSIRILYGGSVKPDNAHEIIHLDNVDGLLVGGASLASESFCSIVRAC